MRKFIFALLAMIVILAAGACAACTVQTGGEGEYLRIHVRANSNGEADQTVKYAVKDEVVKFLTPFCAECDTKQAAMERTGRLLKDIERVCEGVLKENGFDYGARASLKSEKFPTRAYGELTLSEGVYDALIIELGTGKGDNWWCVIYPPLCFTSGAADVEYRSFLYELFKGWIG